MLLVLGAVLAGILTTLAPCVLPLLPIIVGGSLDRRGGSGHARAYIITTSLGVSVVVFTLLLRASTLLIDIPETVWQWISGLIIGTLGLVSLFPVLWESIAASLSLQGRSTRRLASAGQRDGVVGAVLTGAALGPVFASCSPLYAYVVVTVLPASLAEGLVLLFAYAVGLCITLLAVALLGQRVIGTAQWVADPYGPFRRGLGLVFILVAVVVIAGWDKDLQAWILDYSPVRPWELDADFIPRG
jgi:cytochrome c biogenesis protein CcdA